jgi:hypothetical protein
MGDVPEPDLSEMTRAINTYLAAATYAEARWEDMPFWMAEEYFGWPWEQAEWRPAVTAIENLTEARRLLDQAIERSTS